jgi:hypothetical protein
VKLISKNNILPLLALLLFLVHINYLWNFTVDDAYISFRYADNLAQGKGLVFNVGEKQEGYSNFLWIILLSIFSWLGIEPVASSKFLCIISGAGIFILTFSLSKAFSKRNSSINYIALFLLATNTSVTTWVASGMETIFYTFLLLLSSYLFLKECKGQGIYLSALCFLLLALTRPEGILFFSLPMLFRVVDLLNPDSQFTRRSFFIYLLIFFLPFGAYLIWKYLYFGTIIPNPFYAKFKSPLPLNYQPANNKLRIAFHYLTQGFLQYNLLVIIPFLGFLLGQESRERRNIFFIGGVILLQLFFIMSVGGDWMPHFRFLVPIYPFIYLLFQAGINAATVQIKNRYFIFCLFLAVTVMCAANFPLSKSEHTEYNMAKEGELKRIREFGGWLKQTFPSHYTVAYEEAGIPMYYSRLKLLDVLGLLDRDIAKIWFSYPVDYWEVNKRVVEYVLSKKTELIIIVSHRYPRGLRDFKSGISYTFYHNAIFRKQYKLIEVKDWFLPHENILWPEGLSLFVYLRDDLKSLYEGIDIKEHSD